MEQKVTYRREIDLKDLLFAILYKWKIIVLGLVLFAMLFGGYKGIKLYQEKTNPDVIEANIKVYEEKLGVYEKTKELYECEIENIKDNIADQTEYLENSIWLNVNPYDICEARADIYITTDYEIMPGTDYQNVDYTETVLQVYQTLLTSNAVIDRIAENIGTEPRYLNELITVSTGTVSGRLSRILTINVKHTSQENAKMVLDEFLGWMENLQPRVVETIGEHSIHIISNDVSSRVNLELADFVVEQKRKLNELETNLVNKQKELDELKIPQISEISMSSIIKTSCKFAILGGILGTLVVSFSICIWSLMADRVYSAKELKNRSGIRVLGNLQEKECKCIIDRWLQTLEGRVFKATDDENYKVIVANAQNYISDTKKLLITGSVSCDKLSLVAKKMQLEMPDIEVVYGGNMIETAETLKMLAECDEVVLVEQCQKSDYNTIENEVEKIVDFGKNVVGCIVIG